MLKDTSKISLFEKLIYGSGAFGMNALYTLFSTYVQIGRASCRERV